MPDFLKEIESKVDAAGNIDYTLFDDFIKLKEMNDKHAFINSLGGKPCVMADIYDEGLNKEILEFPSPADIKLRYCNSVVYVRTSQGERPVPLGKYWLEHPQRRTYSTVVFDPKKPKEFKLTEESPFPIYNMWEGFSVTPAKGNWKRMRTHVWDVMCNKDKTKFKYVMRWFAWCVQNVSERAEVAVIFKGKQGAGKGILMSQFAKIFGPHYMTISSSEQLTGRFNNHLRKCIFLFADEAYDPKDRESEGKLKQLITEPNIPIESKFKDTILAKNRLHIAMATNNDRVIIAGEDSRRFFINLVDNRYAKGQGKTDDQRDTYFTPIWQEMDNGGREAMVYDLLNTRLYDWHPRKNIPETEEMHKQRRLQFTDVNAILEWFELGEFPGRWDGINYVVKSSTLERHMRDKIPTLKDPKIVSWMKIIAILNKVGISKENRRIRRLGDGIHLTMEELPVMRRAWDSAYPYYKGKWDHEIHPGSAASKEEIEIYNLSRKWIIAKDAF